MHENWREYLEKVVKRRFVNKQMWWAFLEISFCGIVVTAVEQQVLVFSHSPVWFCSPNLKGSLLQLKGKKCPECACKMPKALLLLWTKSDFEQGGALLVLTVGLRVGDSALGLLMGQGLGKCLWNPELLYLHHSTLTWAASSAILYPEHCPWLCCGSSRDTSQVPAVVILLPLPPLPWQVPPFFARKSRHVRREDQDVPSDAAQVSLQVHTVALTKVVLPSAASWSFACGWICNKLKVILVFVARSQCCKDQSADLRSYWQFGFLSYMKYMGKHFILVMQTTLCLISLTW